MRSASWLGLFLCATHGSALRRPMCRLGARGGVALAVRGGAADDAGYYGTLGVGREASESEIKRAFRRRSLSCHPDKGGDEESFKKLTEAHEVLSDPSKRRAYDRYGIAGVDASAAQEQARARSRAGAGAGAGGGPGVDASTAQQMFEQMFGSFGGAFGDAFGGNSGPFGGAFSGAAGRQRQPRRFAITVSLDDCFVGRIITVGVGSQTCRVRVEPGMGSGDTVRATLGGTAVLFELREAPHAVFSRRNADLLVDAQIPLADALGGSPRVTIKRLDGSTLRARVASPGSVLQHGALRALDGEGMPIRGGGGARGRLFVRVSIVCPEHLELDARQRAQLRSLLSASPSREAKGEEAAFARARVARAASPSDWGRAGSQQPSASSRRRPSSGNAGASDTAGFRFAFR